MHGPMSVEFRGGGASSAPFKYAPVFNKKKHRITNELTDIFVTQVYAALCRASQGHGEQRHTENISQYKHYTWKIRTFFTFQIFFRSRLVQAYVHHINKQ